MFNKNSYMKSKMLIFFLALSSFIAPAQEPEQYKAYVVSNSHLDTQWNWDIQTTISEYIPNTVRRNLWLLENYPDYVFNFEGAVKYAWMKEYYPLEYEKVVQAVREGRWHVSGSSWDANDTNIPSPESVFRNILLGQEFYKKEFGQKSTDIFLPDCFGFSYTLPAIASHCGLIGFSTQKLLWRKNPFHGDERIPFPMGMWYGIDGSAIQSAFDCGQYVYNFPEGCDVSESPELVERARRGPDGTAYRYYGTGDKGGSASIWSVSAVSDAVRHGDGPVKVISATSDQAYKDYIASGRQASLPAYRGELLMDVHGTGCYTSQAAMKRFNRRNEQLADAAERASVMADWTGALPYQKDKINSAWKRFIWHQFHDDLTGTSIQRAYTFSWNDEVIAQSQFADVMRAASGAVSQGLDTRTKGLSVLVYNPAAYERTSVVEASVPFAKAPTGVAVYGPDGRKVPSQLLSYSSGEAKIIFSADMKPVSYAVYDVRPSGSQGSSKNLSVSENVIENAVYKVTLDSAGDMVSVIDKRYGKELVEKGKAVGPVVFDDNMSSEWPAWEIMKSVIDSEPEYIDGDTDISVVENGPLRATVKVEKTFGDSRIVQYISLTDGASDDRIDISAEIDWAQKNSLLKVVFPWTVSNPEAVYDLGLGHVGRGNNTDTAYEVVAQHWADLTAEDGSYGISVINDCKYGWDKPADNTLRLTLIHSPGVEKRYKYQQIQDFGHHTVRYSIFGHSGDAIDAGIVAEGEDLNQPLVSYLVEKHPGVFGKSFSFIDSDSDQIAVKALKKAEDGNGYIVRIYETAGRDAEGVRLSFPADIVAAYEVNGIEKGSEAAEFEGRDLLVSAGAFEPRTFRVLLSGSDAGLPQMTACCLSLPYNMKAISPDAFMHEADADSLGNSYSDELMPDTLVNNGIPFVRGHVAADNAVRCAGQKIALPKDVDYDRVYLLVAASDRDRHAEFSANGRTFCFDVPYYSGFYAQWGQTSFSEGYVKDAEIAYVGDHRHNADGHNEPYVFTYLYQIAIDMDGETGEIVLPDDPHIILFAATAVDTADSGILPAMEVRALPASTL